MNGITKKAVWNSQGKKKQLARGKGAYSFRGELKRGISLNKKMLNRRIRHGNIKDLKNAEYRKTCRTINIVSFS